MRLCQWRRRGWAASHITKPLTSLRHSLWGLYVLVADSSFVFHNITITDHGTHRIPINEARPLRGILVTSASS
jgi:hypothetical protein